MDQSPVDPANPVLHGSRAAKPLPWTTVFALAALGVPRVVLHDLGVTGDGFGLVSALFTVVPVGVWVVVLVRRSPPAPIATGATIGAVYGVLLAGVHQILWNEAFEDDPPRLGGNLEDRFSESTEELVLRLASVPSGIGVGLLLGAGSGLLARFLLDRRTS